MQIENNMQAYVDYLKQFQTKLADVVNKGLKINNPTIAQIKASSIYSPKLVVEAASVGFEMDLPVDVSVAFIVVSIGIQFEKDSSTISMYLSSKTKETHKMHLEFASIVDSAIGPYRGTKIGHEFINRVQAGLDK